MHSLSSVMHTRAHVRAHTHRSHSHPMKSREVPPKEDLNLLNCDPGQDLRICQWEAWADLLSPSKKHTLRKDCECSRVRHLRIWDWARGILRTEDLGCVLLVFIWLSIVGYFTCKLLARVGSLEVQCLVNNALSWRVEACRICELTLSEALLPVYSL